MAPAGSGDATAAEAAEDDIEIPIDLIRALNVSGTVRLGQAFLSGMTFDNMQLGINAAGGKLRLHPISAELFDGTYKGDVRIDASGATPALSVNENISGVSLASLARSMFDQDNITGTINGSFVLSGSGPSLAAIRQDLDGTMSFELIDGAFEGTDVWHQLRSARATFKHEPVPEPRLPARTEFTSVTASGTVNDGVFSNNDLLAELPFLRLTGGGVVNLVAATVDYAMQVRVLDRPEFVDQASEAELADFSSAVIPLKISGPLASPSIRPDLEALVRQEVERQIEEKKEELTQQVLDQIFGEEPAEDAAAPAEDGEQPEEEKSAEDQVKDALRNIFKR
jgi:AsmA protein